MKKVIAPLFIAVAAVAGGVLALTGFGSSPETVQAAVSANATTATARTPVAADDLGTWQETRIRVGNTSNTVR